MMQNAGLSVGALLRSRREELGQDTETVSRQLRIRTIYLRAIEEGRIQDLPGATYAVGFVRSYADFLGFDGNSVVASFRDELGQRGRPETVNWQIEDRDGGFPFFKILVVLAVIAGAGYGLWWYLANTQSGSGLIEAVPEYLKKSTGTEKPATPANGQAPAGQVPGGQSGNAVQPAGGAATESQAAAAPSGQTAAPDASAAAASPQPVSGDQEAENKQAGTATPPASVASQPAASAITAPAATAQPPAAPTAPAATETAPAAAQANPAQPATAQPATAGQAAAAPATTGGEAAPEVAAAASSPTTRISVHAKLESWVQITDKDGKPVLSRVLRAGETYAVPDEKGLVMNTGNAGGIDLLVDGKALPSLGSVGLVKRNITLDPDKLVTGNVTAKPPAGKTDGGAEAPAAAPAD